MSYFTKLTAKLPSIKSELINPDNTLVSIIDSSNIIKLLDLPWTSKEIRLIQIWVKPHSYVPIHIDKDTKKLTHQLWGLLLPVENYTATTAHIYRCIDDSKISSTQYETGPIPFLDIKYAEVVESYDISSGPAFFESGKEWHGASNNTDHMQHCVSIRSASVPMQEIFDYLVNRWPLSYEN
jgi:hypothetical protein